LLDGQVRSRRLRRASADAWLAPRLQTLAVIELQGVMSFGVAAHMAEQVREALQPRHQRVILDASRVAAWDATALARLRALERDLGQQGVRLVVSAVDGKAAASLAGSLRVFPDLDRALEWAEDELLNLRTVEQRLDDLPEDLLGEIGEGMSADGRQALESVLVTQAVPPRSAVLAAGDTDTDLLIVQSGRITLATAWPAADGLRLATVSQGMAFGEMAFLNGQPRSAFAGSEEQGAHVTRLARPVFDAWARHCPADALIVMGNLAYIGTRRLAATTRQLRAVLE
jgi:SulP family sulfate permease